ncbi:hypothetical protein HDU86_008444, partial [Geranomyces michiganensis]
MDGPNAEIPFEAGDQLDSWLAACAARAKQASIQPEQGSSAQGPLNTATTPGWTRLQGQGPREQASASGPLIDPPMEPPTLNPTAFTWDAEDNEGEDEEEDEDDKETPIIGSTKSEALPDWAVLMIARVEDLIAGFTYMANNLHSQQVQVNKLRKIVRKQSLMLAKLAPEIPDITRAGPPVNPDFR